MTTLAANDRPGFFARVSAFFASALAIFREAREMRATFGGKYDE